jgi:hypothetical protein
MLQKLLAGVSGVLPPQPVISGAIPPPTVAHQEVYAEDYNHDPRDSREPVSRRDDPRYSREPAFRRDRSRSPNSRISHEPRDRPQRRYTADDRYERVDDDRKRRAVDLRHDDRFERRNSVDVRPDNRQSRRVFESKDQAQFHQVNPLDFHIFKMEKDQRFAREPQGQSEIARQGEPPYCEEASFQTDIPEGSVRVMSRCVF